MFYMVAAIVIALAMFGLLRSLAGPIAIFVLIVLATMWWNGSAHSQSLHPCEGISDNEIISAFNAHGYRFGGSAGPVLAAVGAIHFPSTIDGSGYCAGYLTLAKAGDDPRSATTIQVNVERQSNGALRITQVMDLR